MSTINDIIDEARSSLDPFSLIPYIVLLHIDTEEETLLHLMHVYVYKQTQDTCVEYNLKITGATSSAADVVLLSLA